MAAADVVPFVDDDEDEEAQALYKGPSKSEDDDADTGKSQGTKGAYGPSGSGKSGGSSQMPSTVDAPASDDPDEQDLVAPKYTAPDRSALQAAQAKQSTDATAIDRNAPGVKPTWKDRLLGGLAGFMSQDAAGGASVTNRKYNQAVAQQKANLSADQTVVNTEQSKLEAEGQDFEHQLQANRGQVATANANSLTGERAAKAAKYDAAIDPKSIHQNDDGEWEGTTYGGKTVPASPPAGFNKPLPQPKTYEELVSASENPQYSDDQRAGFRRAAKTIQGTEVKKFQSTAPRQSDEELWIAAFKRDNGRAPNADELEQHSTRKSSAASGRTARSIDDKAATAYQAIEKQISDGDLDPNVPEDAAKIKKAKQNVEDQRHQDMTDIGVQHTRFVYDDANKGHNEGPSRQGPGSQQRQAATPPQQGGPGKAPRPGAPIDRAGIQHYLQMAGGDKAKARDLIKADNWTIPVSGKKG
jgi:hypothetical protein